MTIPRHYALVQAVLACGLLLAITVQPVCAERPTPVIRTFGFLVQPGFPIPDYESEDSLSVTVPDGWVVTSGSCLQGGTPIGAFDGIDTVTGLALTAAEFVECAFTTARSGTIIVEKVTIPGGDLSLEAYLGEEADA